MKHYPHHIGDFDRATRHLTRMERSVYRDLIDLYYDTEKQLSTDMAWICRRILARSNEESTAVEQVLNEFFTKTPNGWYHSRCEAEIEAYHANTSQKALAGKASAEAKRLKKRQALNACSTPVETPLNSVVTAGNGTPTNQSTNQPINHQPIVAVQLLAPKARRKQQLPPDFYPNETGQAAATAKGLHIPSEFQKFHDYHVSKANLMADWQAAWRTWVSNARPTMPQQATETGYQRSMREKYEVVAPSIAARAPGAIKRLDPNSFFDDLQISSGPEISHG